MLVCAPRCRILEASDSSLTPRRQQRAGVPGLHDAFFQAYDAMLGGDSVTADACQLAFLQDKLLPAVQDDDSEKEENAERKATL
ncbi:hypothetical protein GN958_ATG13364 [Phytophthora infestans]|uniref:Uncharacterized protein n=1 Tax=Phytophthora infestans TaxID=4787 RepID=A0A8S9UGC5_PHYIN|nr:hypothetical protein GN958_ATG13364 [Phytophthora infestans]